MAAVVALEAAIQGMKFAAEKLDAAINKFNELNNKALTLGTSYNDVAERGIASTKGLTLSLDSKFGIGLELTRNNLQGNSDKLVKLAATQEALGKSSAETIRTFKEVSIVGAMTNQQMNNLAKTTLDTGLTYKVSSEVLVQAINKLGPSLENIALAGGDSAALAGAVTDVIGQLGGERNEGRVTQFANMLLDTSMENQQRLVTLGIKNIQDLILAGGLSQEQQADLLKQAMVKAGQSVEGFSTNNALGVQLSKQLFGEQAGAMRQLKNEVQNFKITPQNAEDQFKKTMENLDNIMKSIFTPLQEFAMRFVQPIINFLTPPLKIFSDIIAEVTPFFEELFNVFGEIFTYLKNLFTNFFGGTESLIESLKLTLLPVIGYVVAQLTTFFSIVALVVGVFVGVFAALGKLSQWVLDFILPGTTFTDIINFGIAVLKNFMDILSFVGQYVKTQFANIVASFKGAILTLESSMIGAFQFMNPVARFAGVGDDRLKEIQMERTSLEAERMVRNIELKDAQNKLFQNIRDDFNKLNEKTDELIEIQKEPIPLPEFLQDSNSQINEAFKVMLGLQSANPVVGQMITLNQGVNSLLNISQQQVDKTDVQIAVNQEQAKSTQDLANNTRKPFMGQVNAV
jgi:hypothetical protein